MSGSGDENGWSKWQELVLFELRNHGAKLEEHTKCLKDLKITQAVQAERLHHQTKGTARLWAAITATLISGITFLISWIIK